MCLQKGKGIFWQTYTHRSPYDPDAILLPNFKCLGSISQTSIPSLGIVKWSSSHFTSWSGSSIESTDCWMGSSWFWNQTQGHLATNHFKQCKLESRKEEYKTFYNYLKEFTKGKITYEIDKTTNELSDKISDDLKKRGMKFVGSTIIYSYLQAIGVIYSHDKYCYLYKDK